MKPYILNANKHGDKINNLDTCFDATNSMEDQLKDGISASQVRAARKKQRLERQDEVQRARRKMKRDLDKIIKEGLEDESSKTI